MIKTFENFNELDPYGEENWDDDKPIIIGNLMVSENLGRHNWYEAMKLCKNYKSEGFDDWRLPTKNELNEIYKYYKKFGEFVAHPYWSSSEYSATFAWAQNFNIGLQYNYYHKSNFGYVRTVRSF